MIIIIVLLSDQIIVFRFSLLLLEPGEIYFEDLSVYFYTSEQKYRTSQLQESDNLGRLKICSKSLVFEPKNTMQPIIKMKFENCTSINKVCLSEKER